MQIRTRLTLQFILIVASIMLVAMMYIYFQVKSHLLEEFYNSLRSKANLTAAVAIARIESDSLMEIGSTSADRFTVFTENMSIYDASDRLVYTFHPAPRGFQIDVLSDIRNYGENHLFQVRLMPLDKTSFPLPGKICDHCRSLI